MPAAFWSCKKCFHVLFQFIITNEVSVPVAILNAYILIPRRIRKDVLIRRIIASQLQYVQQLVASNFAKNGEKFKRELCLNA